VDVKRLEAIPLFRDLHRRDLEKISRWADEVDLKTGYHLLDQGRLPHEFFVIEEGEVEIHKDGELITTLGPGDFLGEIAILEHERRTASVVAKTPVTAIVMGSREFEVMSKEMPAVAGRVHDAIRERMGR
jgi:CRP/FNR family transcriptional regulator, cyclic AMP receptor protein